MARLRSHITEKEAFCRCGCGLKPSEDWLDTVNIFLDLYGKPVGISTMYRCKKYNKRIGGVKDSPHQYSKSDLGGADIKCRSPKSRDRIIYIAMAMKHLGFLNQIEVCNYHIHIAKVPKSHRLAGLMNWGKSR